MKIIFFGLGSIGTRHARILQEEFAHELYAFRSSNKRPSNKLGIHELFDWRAVEKVQPDVAFICNPTSMHLGTALECAKRGMHLFIEKPLGGSLAGLKELISTIKAKRLTTYVAYCLRFHPVIEALAKRVKKERPLHMRVWCSSYFPSWRPGRNHLDVYSAQRKLGGGVINDLSHEFDYAQYLLRDIKKIEGSFGRQSKVTVDAEDFADILLSTATAPVNIHLNMMSHLRQRVVQVDFKNETVVGDLRENTLTVYRRERVVSQKIFKGPVQEYLRRQIKYFFANIHNRKMMNNVPEAAGLFRKIIAFKNGEKV